MDKKPVMIDDKDISPEEAIANQMVKLPFVVGNIVHFTNKEQTHVFSFVIHNFVPELQFVNMKLVEVRQLRVPPVAPDAFQTEEKRIILP